MTEQELLDALSIGEGTDWEFKSARGGLPASMWESYSAMANTDGGTIGLGIDEKDGVFRVSGLPDPAKMQKSFWDTINNRGKVSINLLSDADVEVVTVGSDSVLLVKVPRAARRERPVYVGQNPLDGTYRRNYEGDYKCRREEVGRMLADQSEQPADSIILQHFTMDDLDAQSIAQYRNRFASRSSDHPWLAEDDKGLLMKLGGWRQDRASGADGLTVAGLMMFGTEGAIRDPHGIPQYNVDYRERLSEDPEVRWTDRLTLDGTWAGNLFQFYQKVITRLFADLKVPFQMGPDLFRKDETIVHEAIREALVNALIHADFHGQGGVIIEKYRDRFEMSNPGTLLLSIDQMLQGGVSECRNKSLQLMFQQIGGGEKAGSGIDKIRQGWASQKWRWPIIHQPTRPDRVKLVLPMVSLLPEETVEMLKAVLGENIGGLSGEEIQALVTAHVEGCVTNLRLQQFSRQHTADLTKMLQDLCSRGLLEKDGYGRWASYRLSPQRFPVSDGSSSSPHIEGSSPHRAADSSHSDPEDAQDDPILSDPDLLKVTEASRTKSRLKPEETEQMIEELCRGRFLNFRQIGILLGRDPRNTRDRFLSKLVQEGRLTARYPDEPTHPSQAYTTTEEAE